MVIHSKTYDWQSPLIITLTQAKANLRIEHDLDDAEIQSMIYAAYQSVENHINRVLIAQSVTYQVNCSSNSFHLNLPEYTAFTTIESVDAVYQDGTSTPVTGKTIKLVNGVLEISSIVVNNAENVSGYRVTVQYTPNLLDYALNAAVYLTLTHMYENRNNVVVGTVANKLPYGVESICATYKRYAL